VNTPELLQSRKLRITKPRTAVLELFQTRIGKAISIKELLDVFQTEIDKVTLYRTLHTFEESDLIHRIFDDSGLEKYALCVGTCEDHHADHVHNHGHIHFKCEKCLETECISDLKMPTIELPAGYETKSTNFVIIGNCARCNAEILNP
jgi:Fur family ferric uptake transcriptional regulator